jgi:hypothetical protein
MGRADAYRERISQLNLSSYLAECFANGSDPRAGELAYRLDIPLRGWLEYLPPSFAAKLSSKPPMTDGLLVTLGDREREINRSEEENNRP